MCGCYASLEPPIVPHAHQQARHHQEDGVGIANGGFSQWFWQVHCCRYSGDVLYRDDTYDIMGLMTLWDLWREGMQLP